MIAMTVGPTMVPLAAFMAGDTISILTANAHRKSMIMVLCVPEKLSFNPLVVRGDSNVVETRDISLLQFLSQ
jgi:hypothetical protein